MGRPQRHKDTRVTLRVKRDSFMKQDKEEGEKKD